MYLDLNSEQKMLAQTARRFVEKEVSSSRIRKIIGTKEAYDEELWQQMAEQGWMGLTVPDEFGGLGESWLTVAALFEELGRGIVPGPFLPTVGFAVPALVSGASAAQKDHWLTQIANGTCRATVAYLEQSGGFSGTSPGTTAENQGGQVALSGTKMFVLDASVADLIIVWAREEQSKGLFLVEKNAPGLKVEILEGMDLTRRLARVSFEKTPAEKMGGSILPEKVLEEALLYASFALSAESIGGMQWVLDTAVAYAKIREQYGRLIGSYQAVSHPLVDRTLELMSTRSALYSAAFALDHRSDEKTEAVSMLKALASDGFRQAGYTGVQTLGGIGFTWDHDMQLYFRRAGASWSLFGDPHWHREKLLSVIGV